MSKWLSVDILRVLFVKVCRRVVSGIISCLRTLWLLQLFVSVCSCAGINNCLPDSNDFQSVTLSRYGIYSTPALFSSFSLTVEIYKEKYFFPFASYPSSLHCVLQLS
jgi:hypothetical protein